MMRSLGSRLGYLVPLLLAVTVAGIAGAFADTYPSRPIRLIVLFAAGGLNDVVARLVRPYFENSLGQLVIVDNRPSGNSFLRTDASANQAPDGHTLLVC